jgi:GNAT superfamily N-acetyltransferase
VNHLPEDTKTGDITIRQAGERDVEALCDLYFEFHAFHVRGMPDRLAELSASDPEERRKLRDRIRAVLSGDRSSVWVATRGTRMIGLAEVYIRESEPDLARISRRFGHLQSLVVTEANRGQGIGRALCESAIQWARERGATEMKTDIWEFDGGPLGFYERSGFRTLRRIMIRDLEPNDRPDGR